jgi:hypothetical protein
VEYVIAFDPQHRVLRVTFEKTLTEAILLHAYEAVAQFTCAAGSCFGIADFSAVEVFQISTAFIVDLAEKAPAIPEAKIRVVVAPMPVIFGLARMFGSLRHGMKGQYHVVRTLAEAYALIGFSSLDFSVQL